MLEVKLINLYYGAAQALRGVSLSATPGEVTCVLGRNGVGKTSLLRALIGQHPISSGAIVFDGPDITKLRPFERARNGIAYVPQGREIFPLLTVEENLKTGFAPLKRDQRSIPDDVFSLFPVLGDMLRPARRRSLRRPAAAARDRPGAGDAAAAVAARRADRRHPAVDHQGYRPRHLVSAQPQQIAIVLVEQYLDFACELGDNFAVMDRGAIVYSCDRAGMEEAALKRALAI